MARTTVDLTKLLQELNALTNRGPNMVSIQIWPDGSYLLGDGGGEDILNSDKLDPAVEPLSSIHGLAYMDATDLLAYADKVMG